MLQVWQGVAWHRNQKRTLVLPSMQKSQTRISVTTQEQGHNEGEAERFTKRLHNTQ